MTVLHALESIRVPLFDSFFSLLTYLGDETVFLVACMIVFWCVNKKTGRYLIAVGLAGTVLNQFLKLFFRIPRPWVQDETLTIVESARSGAGGYSFPSGHTQSAVGVFGGIALTAKQKWLKAVCVIICVLVPFSRLYLGVHTPLDVGVGAVLSVVLLLILYPAMSGPGASLSRTRAALIATVLVSAAFVAYAEFNSFPADIDAENLGHGVKNAWTLFGSALGFWLAFEIDEKYIHFKTQAPLAAQLLKASLGVLLCLAVRVGLKSIFNKLLPGDLSRVADALRYGIMVLVGCAAWPLAFPWLGRIARPANEKGTLQ